MDSSAPRGPATASDPLREPKFLGEMFPNFYEAAHREPNTEARKELAELRLQAFLQRFQAKMRQDEKAEEGLGGGLEDEETSALDEAESGTSISRRHVRTVSVLTFDQQSLLSGILKQFKSSEATIVNEALFIETVHALLAGAGFRERFSSRFLPAKGKLVPARYTVGTGAFIQSLRTAATVTEAMNLLGRLTDKQFSLSHSGLIGLELGLWLFFVMLVSIQQYLVWAVGAELPQRDYDNNAKLCREKKGDALLFTLPVYASRLLTFICIGTAITRFCEGFVSAAGLLQGERKFVDPNSFDRSDWFFVIFLGSLTACADFITHTTIGLSNHARSMQERHDFLSAPIEQHFRYVFKNFQFYTSCFGGRVITFSPASVISKFMYLTYALIQGYLHYKAPEKAAELIGVNPSSVGMMLLRVLCGSLTVWAVQCFEVEHMRGILVNTDPRGLERQATFANVHARYMALDSKKKIRLSNQTNHTHYRLTQRAALDSARKAALTSATLLMEHEERVLNHESSGLIDPRASLPTQLLYPRAAYRYSVIEFFAGFTRLLVEFIHLIPVMELLYFKLLVKAAEWQRKIIFGMLLGLVSVGTASLLYVGLTNVVLGGTFYDLTGYEGFAKHTHSVTKTSLVASVSYLMGFALNFGRMSSMTQWAKKLDELSRDESSPALSGVARDTFPYEEYNHRYQYKNFFWSQRASTFVDYFGGRRVKACFR